MELDFLDILFPMLLTGLKVTLYIAILGILLGSVLGTVTGLCLQGGSRILRFIANVYIWIIRGTPMVVQALYVYFVIPKLFDVDLASNTAGVIVITMNSGAFIAEIVRGAIAGIDPGQKEAGLSLGLSGAQIMMHIIIPPAFRSMIPPLFNQFITSVKDTSILSIIVVTEITKQIQNYAALSFKTIEAYTTGALFYLVLISVLIVFQKHLERKISRA